MFKCLFEFCAFAQLVYILPAYSSTAHVVIVLYIMRYMNAELLSSYPCARASKVNVSNIYFIHITLVMGGKGFHSEISYLFPAVSNYD